ncbi:MAG: hypothetical protein K5855_00560 [Oscillospiraceae bacterium]|jgi:hypothetical protein|nr:hypothetical protein [Oscillospiraceae bacterium]
MSARIIPGEIRPHSPGRKPAEYSAGEVARFDVDDRTAVMLMAIVADETQIPVNELRFISIKEVK